MMTNQNVRETDREKLAKAIRFYRDMRKMRARDIADRVGVSIGEYEAWEAGTRVPPDHKWGRLCNMLHSDLANMRATWQRARAEEERDKAIGRDPAKPLTVKPFANLPEIINKPEPPKLTVVPDPPPAPTTAIPDTLLGDEYDLRPAYIGVQKLPAGWQSSQAKAARQAYALSLIVAGKLNSDEIVKEVKRKFNVGITLETLAALRKQAQDKARAAHVMTRGAEVHEEVGAAMKTVDSTESVGERAAYVKMILGKAPSTPIHGPNGLHTLLLRKFNKSLSDDRLAQLVNDAKAARTTGQVPVVVPTPEANPKDVEAAVRLILEAIPNLRSFTLEVDDAGEVQVSHKVREVKVVESSGSFKIKR